MMGLGWSKSDRHFNLIGAYKNQSLILNQCKLSNINSESKTARIYPLPVYINTIYHKFCIHIKGHYEPGNSKKYNLACLPGEDSDQPEHPLSLIRVLVFHLKKQWTLGYQQSAHLGLRSACANAQADPSL